MSWICECAALVQFYSAGVQLQTERYCCFTWKTETSGSLSPFLALMTDRGFNTSNSGCAAAIKAVSLLASVTRPAKGSTQVTGLAGH